MDFWGLWILKLWVKEKTSTIPLHFYWLQRIYQFLTVATQASLLDDRAQTCHLGKVNPSASSSMPGTHPLGYAELLRPSPSYVIIKLPLDFRGSVWNLLLLPSLCPQKKAALPTRLLANKGPFAFLGNSRLIKKPKWSWVYTDHQNNSENRIPAFFILCSHSQALIYFL